MTSTAPYSNSAESRQQAVARHAKCIKARSWLLSSFFLLFIFGLTSPILPRAWQFGASGLELVQLPSSLQPVEPPTTGDLNGNGLPERLSLSSSRASIYENEDLVWQSPPEWSISQAALTDLNQDGQLEATLLVWREFRPWPVDAWLPHGGRIASFHDAQNQSCHIILIGYSRGAYRELWAGSALADPIVSFAAADLDGDGVQELATLEGSYTTHRSGIAHTLKIWRWNFFGFNAVSSIEGTFHQMALSIGSEGSLFVLTP
jgi:hypothetical protein